MPKSVPALVALLVAVSPGLAQKKPEKDLRSLIAALQRVQSALHTAENAQLALIGSPVNSQARQAVDRAVAELSKARQSLRDQLAGKAARRNVEIARPAGKKPKPRRAKPRKELPRPREKDLNRAIEAGLKWLAAHQDEDGKWDSDNFFKHDPKNTKREGAGNPVHDVGATGLALLAFLGSGSTLREGPYRDNVVKAAKWLRNQQGPNGLFGTNASHDFIYSHAIAAFAMCEVYGLSKYEALKKSAQMGINYLESHRNPYAVWRYQPRDNDNDSSVTGWCLKAYKSALDFDLEVNKQAMKIIANYLDELTDPATGRLGYTKRGELSSRNPGDHNRRFPVEKGEALTALGLASRFALAQSPRRVAVMKLAAERLLEKLPTLEDKGAVDHYYWFHGTFGMWGMGGRYWDHWVRAVSHAAMASQRKDAPYRGSWDNSGVWGKSGGRVYSTAMMLMSLQAVARYDTLVRRRDN